MDSLQNTATFHFGLGVFILITAGGCFLHLLCPVYKDFQLEGIWKMGLTFTFLGSPMVALYPIIKCCCWNGLRRELKELRTTYIVFGVIFLVYIVQLIYIWGIMDWITINGDSSQIANDSIRELHVAVMKPIYNVLIPLTMGCVPILGIIYTSWYFSAFIQIRDRINRILPVFSSRFRDYYNAYQYSVDNKTARIAGNPQRLTSSV